MRNVLKSWSFGGDVTILVKLYLPSFHPSLPLSPFSLYFKKKWVQLFFLCLFHSFSACLLMCVFVCATFTPVKRSRPQCFLSAVQGGPTSVCVWLTLSFPMRVSLTLHWDPMLVVITTVSPAPSHSFPHEFSHRTKNSIVLLVSSVYMCVCVCVTFRSD